MQKKNKVFSVRLSDEIINRLIFFGILDGKLKPKLNLSNFITNRILSFIPTGITKDELEIKLLKDQMISLERKSIKINKEKRGIADEITKIKGN